MVAMVPDAARVVPSLIVAPRAAVLVDHLAARGVRALAVGPDRLRFVTHRDLDEGAVELCLSAVAAWAGAPHSD